MNLLSDLEAAEAEVARIKREISQGPCREYGHVWKLLGGRNAGCSRHCGCSVPVYECVKCGDCDYGDNEEAVEILKTCSEEFIDEESAELADR